MKNILLALAPALAAAQTVNLGYATYQGSTSGSVARFLGMRYASPPTGNGRWRAPSAPATVSGTQQATSFGDLCISGTSVPSGQSEDCLFINVYKPASASPGANLPVAVFITGGGYDSLASVEEDGSGLIENSDGGMVFVTMNYRVGILGFIHSEEIGANGNNNAGLWDQRVALQWVQDHIDQFGGNPDHVCIHGQSAGAQSAMMQMIALGGENQGLFTSAFFQSLPEIRVANVSEVEFQYDALSSNTGCSSNSDPLTCLRDLPIASLVKYNQNIAYPGRSGFPEYPFVPVQDGDLIPTRPYEAFQTGNFVKVPMVFGGCNDEGTGLGAPNAASARDIETFFQDNYPLLTDTEAASIVQEYPENIEPAFENHNAWYAAAVLSYGEALVTCVGINFAHYAVGFGVDAWTYNFDVVTSADITNGVGSSHGSDLPAIFGGSYADSNNTNVLGLQSYYTSFVRTLNPNTYRQSGAPEWPQYNGAAGGSRLLITNNDTVVSTVPQAQVSRCDFWEGLITDMNL